MLTMITCITKEINISNNYVRTKLDDFVSNTNETTMSSVHNRAVALRC
ncbi:unnamed protein product [Schistosoma curassoni]|uniref:CPXV003 protein n=1 Tax=Schistosoma curassoni TaxID=6186 RepID=A0A183JJS0_9TREM|nr:unnamed protein product [Schistosoma curassoni]